MKEDMVNSPPHYTQGGIEVYDYIVAKEFNYNLGNAVKYISRCNHKGKKVEDLKKAIWYISKEIMVESERIEEEKAMAYLIDKVKENIKVIGEVEQNE